MFGAALLTDKPFALRGEHLADWIECLCLAHGGQAIARGRLNALAGHVGVPSHELDFARAIVKTRRDTWGLAYPFRVEGGGIRADRDALDAYWVWMLPLGPHARPSTGMAVSDAASAFEALVAHVAGQIYGAFGESRSFAYPSAIGRPAGFPLAVRWLAGEMGLRVGSAYRPPMRKDGGVDVVVWRPFPEGRPGFPVTLLQCTVGNELRRKARDIDVRMWSGWLSLDVEPSTALAFPFVLKDGTAWDELSRTTTVLDRGRIASMSLFAPPVERPSWVDETVAAWRAEVH